MNGSSSGFLARLFFLSWLLVASTWFGGRPTTVEPSSPEGSRLPLIDAPAPTAAPLRSPSASTAPPPISAPSLEQEKLELRRVASPRAPAATSIPTPTREPPEVNEREIWWGSPERRWLALTFDAEVPGLMGIEVLDSLRDAQVPATFFVTGAWARRHPELVRRIAAEGHLIGNHTDTHPRLIELSDEAILQELQRAEATLIEILGGDPRPWFRPPFGKRDARVRRIAAEAGYLTIVWSIDLMNWLEPNSPQSMIDKALGQARNGSIIVLHLNRLDAEALPAIIQGLRVRGFVLVTLAELLAP